MTGALELDLLSDTAELPRVRDALRHWASSAGWDEHRVADIVLAVDEALTNVIRHGYMGRPGQKIELRACTIRDPQQGEGVEIRIRDFGRQAPLDKICGRDLDDLRPGGLGVHIIRNVMHFSEYSHAEGGGMRLVMRKYKGQPPAPG
jgi:anti-sigma regulatory factor (Ser/Thr protein kinase)